MSEWYLRLEEEHHDAFMQGRHSQPVCLGTALRRHSQPRIVNSITRKEAEQLPVAEIVTNVQPNANIQVAHCLLVIDN